MQTSTTLYWKAVSFLLRSHDREEHAAELTVRISSGSRRNNHNSRVRVQRLIILFDIP